MILAAILFGRLARAGDAAVAEQLFREGKALMAAHDYAQACPKLAESFRQDPATGTLLALAACQEESGHLATAWATYNGVVARARQDGRADREVAARERVAALEPRLSTMRVNVPSDVTRLPGLLVLRDDTELPPATWGSDLPTDGGTHVVRATAADGKAWEQTVVVSREHDRKIVTVLQLGNEQRAGRSPGAAPAPAAEAAPLSTKGARTTTIAVTPNAPLDANSATAKGTLYQRVGLAVMAAGIVSVGIATGFAIDAVHLDSKSRENGHCTDAAGCDSIGEGLNRQARSRGTTATMLFAAGGVVAAGGLGCLLFGRAKSQSEGSSVAVSPAVSVGFAGATLVGSF